MKLKLSIAVLAVVAATATTAVAGSASIAARPAASSGTIVQVAAATPQLSTLVSLVKKAGLAGALSKGSLTVFAPTNAAFAYLKKHDPATYKSATTNVSVLKKVLTYHVVGKKIPASAATAAAKKGASIKALEGEKISLSLVKGKIKLNRSATVIQADVMASNGVVHVINRVLVPPSLSMK
jgi:uncharacterized surface protein with fasciclin (FAS1) repeats